MRWREQWQPGEALTALALQRASRCCWRRSRWSRSSRWCSRESATACCRRRTWASQDANSGYGNFTWFQDQTAGALDAPTVYSVPMWIYRLLFFVWACWMAFALVGWLRWAFNAWKTNGLWRTE